MVEEDFDLVSFFELASSNKNHVNGLNLPEGKNEVLEGYKGVFELIGLMIIGAVEHKTNIRFRNMDVFESYINAKDVD